MIRTLPMRTCRKPPVLAKNLRKEAYMDEKQRLSQAAASVLQIPSVKFFAEAS